MLLQLPCRALDPAEHARVQTKWLLYSSIEDLPSYLHDQKAVRLLAENTKNIREKAYGDSMEILPMLSLLVEEKISAPASAAVDEALSDGDASSGFMVPSWRDRNALLNAAMGSVLHKIKAAKVPMLGKRVDAKDAVARASLAAELQKSDSRAACLMEPAHGMHGSHKLRDSVPFLPGIYRICVLRAANGAATHNTLLSMLLQSQPKCGPLREPSSFRLIDIFSRPSLSTNITVDSSQDIDSQQLDAFSKRNIYIQHNNECSRSNTESQMDDDSRIKDQKVPIFIRHCSGKYGNNIIDPNCTLLSYGVGRDATVEACSRLLGGKPPTLDEYLPENKDKFLREVTRPDGKKSVDIKKGCRILSSLLKCFTKSFAKRKSWAGQVTQKHFKVVNEHVKVLIKARRNLDRDKLKADIAVLVCWIKSIFSLDGKFPPYLENLIQYLESLNFPILLEHEIVYIETHISCIESIDRGMLLVLLRKKYKSLDQSERRKWKRIVAQAELPGDTDYPDCLSKVAVFKDIIETARASGKAYKNKKNNIFSLARDEFTHGLEHRFNKSVKPWKEKFKDDDGIELMIPAHVDDFPAQFIMALVHSKEIDITAELNACQVHCFCHYCEEDKAKATGSKPSDDQDASGSGSSSNKEATGLELSSSTKGGIVGSGSSQHAESSIKKEDPVLHANASKKVAQLRHLLHQDHLFQDLHRRLSRL
ncbi:unnamed protein product [Urochloa decumbens]|uniref:Uncharacterized protein n=1 Tax=Urochloa decumbens TaxID=240449 RepID=A0ABC9BJ10_9POAL